jgi:CheY-like chemotaxis protein
MAIRVMLVDDSRTVRLTVMAYLVGRGYEFVQCDGGREALATIRRDPPDLVICDVFMPGVDGWELVRAVRADPKQKVRKLPVILVSSRHDEETARRSRLAGADVFLTKPIAGERLLEIIDELLPRSREGKDDEPVPSSSVVASERGGPKSSERDPTSSERGPRSSEGIPESGSPGSRGSAPASTPTPRRGG